MVSAAGRRSKSPVGLRASERARSPSKDHRHYLNDPDKLLLAAREKSDLDTVAAIDRLLEDGALDELLRKAGVENENLKFLALLAFMDTPSKVPAVGKPGPDFLEASKKAAWLREFILGNRDLLVPRWLGYGAEAEGGVIQARAEISYVDLILGLHFLEEACKRQHESMARMLRSLVPATPASRKKHVQPAADIRHVVGKLDKHVSGERISQGRGRWPKNRVIAVLTNVVLGLKDSEAITTDVVKRILDDIRRAPRRSGAHKAGIRRLQIP